MSRIRLTAIAIAVLACFGTAVWPAAQGLTGGWRFPLPEQDDGATAADDEPDGPTLAETSNGERDAIERLYTAREWPKRALAAMRLERFRCEESLIMLDRLARDREWQVRAFALRSLGRQRAEQSDWLENETDPRVVRSALRHRFAFDPAKLETGVKRLLNAADLTEKTLGAELGAFLEDDRLRLEVTDTIRRIVLRMRREEAGALSPRLAVLTGQPDWRSDYRWKRWLPARNAVPLERGYRVPETGQPVPPSRLASIDAERFIQLEGYVQKLGSRNIDLAICLDTTTSMWSHLADAQGGIDDLLRFVGDMSASVRIAIIAYRDARDRSYETKMMPFTFDHGLARRFLWSLLASGGGDKPESVHAALELAFKGLQWSEQATRVVVLVGDAPPEIGTAGRCEALARRGAEFGWVTHVIQAGGDEVDHFKAIASAGSGQCVTLERNGSVIAEITGLTIGDQFAEEMDEFFNTYLALCR